MLTDLTPIMMLGPMLMYTSSSSSLLKTYAQMLFIGVFFFPPSLTPLPHPSSLPHLQLLLNNGKGDPQ